METTHMNSAVIIIMALSISVTALAEQSVDEIAKNLANPNTAFASLTFKPKFTSFENKNGEDFEQTTVLFQLTLPFPRDDGSKIIVRPAITSLADDSLTEISDMFDIASDIFYEFPMKKTDSGSILEGFAAIVLLPPAKKDLGQDEVTALGASYVYGTIGAEDIKIFFPSHLQSVDEGDGVKLSLTKLKLGYIMLPGGGWNYGTNPEISYNWEAESGEELTVPLNFTIGKTVMFGKRPWKFSLDLDYYVVQPELVGSEFAITFTITPVVESSLATWFN